MPAGIGYGAQPQLGGTTPALQSFQGIGADARKARTTLDDEERERLLSALGIGGGLAAPAGPRGADVSLAGQPPIQGGYY